MSTLIFDLTVTDNQIKRWRDDTGTYCPLAQALEVELERRGIRLVEEEDGRNLPAILDPMPSTPRMVYITEDFSYHTALPEDPASVSAFINEVDDQEAAYPTRRTFRFVEERQP